MIRPSAQFWGKARPSGAIPSHSVVGHTLDVAAVATLLGDRRLGIDPRALGFLAALHDVGKYSRPFQAKSAADWPDALGPYEAISDPGHDQTGLAILTRVLGDRLAFLFPGWPTSRRQHVWRALTGHHGRPPELVEIPPASIVCSVCREAIEEFVEALLTIFNPPPLPRLSERAAVRLSWRLAGLTTLSDWVGSRQEWFPYVAPVEVADPGAYYYGSALPQAAIAVAAAGLSRARPSVFSGLRGLFPKLEDPSPVQRWAETVALPPGPVLAVVEDLTGSGKTEAAMVIAHRLMASGRGAGVYFALPTMATANAMHARLAEAYRALFAPEARPSLALAHGRADLNPAFTSAISGDGDARSTCSAWLADDRRRALLANVGVGTVDQALMAILPVRHATLRLYGLSRSVLLVDECHAYDAYMHRELLTLLRFHAAGGGSAILLSATLTLSQRQELTDAFRSGLDVAPSALTETAYPLATLASASVVTETPCDPRFGLPRTVKVTRLDGVDSTVTRIVEAAEAGAAVCWVRNSVDDALEASELLRDAGVDAVLFHARFAMADRLKVEAEVLRRFGKNSSGEDRRCVLVATQVVEQSLDLDFDLLISDLAPADLLIQRAGRLWRHDREERPIAGPDLLVVSPAPVADPVPAWIWSLLKNTGFVYQDHALLWRSARVVFGRGEIVSPGEVRDLVEAAYDTSNVPAGLAGAAMTATTRSARDTARADQSVLELEKGYAPGGGRWLPDTYTPTRLEDLPHVTLRLAVVRDGAVVPYADDPDQRRAWAQSEVSVAEHRVSACPIPPGLQVAADRARSRWGRWERESPRVLLAILQPDGDEYRLPVLSSKGPIICKYSETRGLSW